MRMYKLFFLMTMSGFLIAMVSCDNAKQKVENAEENVVDAENQLLEAKDEYLADVEKHRLMYSERIAANEKSIAEFNARIATEKKEAKDAYLKTIQEIEQKNSDLKRKMDDYTADGKDGWDKFKTEFESDMEKLGNAIEEFGKDKK